MDKTEKRRAFLIDIAYLAVILGLLYVTIKYLLWIALPFILAFAFAYVLQRPLRFLDKKTKHKMHNFWGIVLVVVTILIIILPIVFLIAALVSKIVEFGGELAEELKDLPTFLAKIETWLINVTDFLPTAIHDSVTNTITGWFDKLLPSTDSSSTTTLSDLISNIDLSSLKSTFSSGVSGVVSALKGVPSFLLGLIIGIIAWIIMTLNFDRIITFIKIQLPKKRKNVLSEMKTIFKKTILTMFKAYGIIMLITFLELCLGFIIMRLFGILNTSWYILIAAAIAVFDILPVAGSGGVLVPWAIISLINGNVPQAVGLIVMLTIISIIREYLEPKVVGQSLGVNPIVTLMGLYFGLKLFGFIGMFVVPLSIMTLKAFNDSGRLHLWHSIDERN